MSLSDIMLTLDSARLCVSMALQWLDLVIVQINTLKVYFQIFQSNWSLATRPGVFHLSHDPSNQIIPPKQLTAKCHMLDLL